MKPSGHFGVRGEVIQGGLSGPHLETLATVGHFFRNDLLRAGNQQQIPAKTIPLADGCAIVFKHI